MCSLSLSRRDQFSNVVGPFILPLVVCEGSRCSMCSLTSAILYLSSCSHFGGCHFNVHVSDEHGVGHLSCVHHLF